MSNSPFVNNSHNPKWSSTIMQQYHGGSRVKHNRRPSGRVYSVFHLLALSVQIMVFIFVKVMLNGMADIHHRPWKDV